MVTDHVENLTYDLLKFKNNINNLEFIHGFYFLMFKKYKKNVENEIHQVITGYAKNLTYDLVNSKII